MDRLGYLESFLEVLDQGSLSAAARARNVSQPAISQQMAALEADFGTPLLQRTTSGAMATRAGSIVARHASDMVATHQRMRADISTLATTAGGELRISISKVMGENPVGDALQELHAAYPDMNLTLKVEDRLVDVVREGYDMALRTGDIGAADAIVRKIGQFETVLVAAPSYLDRIGRPKHHSEMGQHAFIQYADHRVYGFHTVRKNGLEAEIELVTKLIVDTPSHLMNALVDGLGYARLPRVLANDFVENGSLETMLMDYTIEPKDIFLVYPHRHAITESARVVVDAIYRGLNKCGSTHIIQHQDLKPVR
jgi:DNA-binding transcriptional LysR family regulator